MAPIKLSKYIAHHRGRRLIVRTHPFADDQEIIDPQLLRDLGAGFPRNDDRLDPRQVPFQVIGKFLKEHIANDRPEDGVTEELESFVRDEPVIRPRRMGQGFSKETQFPEAVAEDLLAFGQQSGIVAVSQSEA